LGFWPALGLLWLMDLLSSPNGKNSILSITVRSNLLDCAKASNRSLAPLLEHYQLLPMPWCHPDLILLHL
jgi:hypothetical protein